MANEIKKTERRLKLFSELVGETWASYKKYFWPLISLSVIPALLTAVASLVMPVQTPAQTTWMEVFATDALYLVVAMLAVPFALGIYHYLDEIHQGKTVAVGQAVKFGFSRAVHGWLLSIYVGVIVAAGFILLIVPGFIFLTWFIFMPIVLAVEKNGLKSAELSKKLTAGYRNQIFLRVFLGALLLVFLTILAAAIGAFLFPAQASQQVYSAIISLLATPLSIVFTYQLYRSVLETKQK